MTSTPPDLTFGVDLCTFFHPVFWGVADRAELAAKAGAEPAWFWERTLDALVEAGISALELTFPPADHRSAIAAYGSIEGFQQALRARNLTVVSGYFGDLEHSVDPLDPENQEAILASADEHAEFIHACGGGYLVVGLPMRRRRPGTPPSFVDLRAAEPIGDLLNRMGAVTQRHGVRVALHTEAHSIFWTGRDVDLFMLLTDPMYVSMCPDTGHLVLGGADPVHVLDRHRERMVIAHWKDAIGPVPPGLPIDEKIHDIHREYFRGVGSGVVDWFGWSRLLRELRYDGCTLLELDAAADPVGEITRARTFVQTALSRFSVA